MQRKISRAETIEELITIYENNQHGILKRKNRLAFFQSDESVFEKFENAICMRLALLLTTPNISTQQIAYEQLSAYEKLRYLLGLTTTNPAAAEATPSNSAPKLVTSL